jgi:hypothetical protein
VLLTVLLAELKEKLVTELVAVTDIILTNHTKFKEKVNVKQFLYTPGQALSFPGI